MHKNTRSLGNNTNSIILFVISPFLSLIYSLNLYKQKWAKNIFWLFCAYFGYTLVIATNSDSDGVRYINYFITLGKASIGNEDFIDKFYSDDSGYIDVVQPLVTFLLSRITDNTHILFTVFGLIFGYFYSRNLWFLLKTINVKRFSYLVGLFIMAFALLNPVWNIVAFRFNTASQVFLFGALPYLIEGKKKKMYISALSIFVHFTFILPVFMLFLYSWLGNRMRFFFLLFIVSSLASELLGDIAQRNLSERELPAIFQKKVDQYTNDEVNVELTKGLENLNWYVKYNSLFIKIVCYAFLTFIFINRKFVINNDSLKSLFCFTLLSYVSSNIANFFPQGIRFSWVNNLLTFFLIVCCLCKSIKSEQKLNTVTLLATPLVIVIVIVAIRRGFEYAGIFTILGNPLILPFNEYDFPLIDLIK